MSVYMSNNECRPAGSTQDAQPITAEEISREVCPSPRHQMSEMSEMKVQSQPRAETAATARAHALARRRTVGWAGGGSEEDEEDEEGVKEEEEKGTDGRAPRRPRLQVQSPTPRVLLEDTRSVRRA